MGIGVGWDNYLNEFKIPSLVRINELFKKYELVASGEEIRWRKYEDLGSSSAYWLNNKIILFCVCICIL